MTLQEVHDRVEFIKRVAGDDEAAHVAEDQLHEDFIAWVHASGAVELAEMARVVLTTQDVEFSRWYA